MIAWLGYTIIVTLFLSAAAFAAERAARALHAPTRWIWAVAIVASLLLPTVVSSISIELPNIFSPASASKPIVLRDAAPVRLAPPEWLATRVAPIVAAATGTTNIDPLVKRAWMAVSLVMLLALAASAIVLQVRKRRWPVQRICGVEVYVTPDAGPAVVGLLRPRIVLPLWLTRASAAKQALVMAHETSHLAARDPQLLSVALCLLVLMPWNLPLWWQLRRLRHAIEVDCDARVLGSGHNLREYGEALVDVGQHRSGYLGAAAAMAESRSFLEQRIRIMLSQPGHWSHAGAVLLSGLALCMVAAAGQLSPPNASPAVAQVSTRPHIDMYDRKQMWISPSRLLDYEGVYQIDEFRMATVWREGARLWYRVNGTDKIELHAERQDQFFSRDVDIQIGFERTDRGRVNKMVAYRGGTERYAEMLDEASGRALTEKIASHAARTTASPGGQAALWRNADALHGGDVNYDDLTPSLAAMVKAYLPSLRKQAQQTPWGKAQAIRFVQVDPKDGRDVYEINYEHTKVRWEIMVNSDGKITEATFVDLGN